ncbi:MAG: hypothetical protein ACKOYM_10330, partial [Actinomycetes bacterium]
LTACHPKYSAKQRIIVVADLTVPAAPPSAPSGRPTRPVSVLDDPATTSSSTNLALAIAFGLGAAAVGVLAWFVGTKWKRWPVYLIATPAILALVWYSWVYLDRYLPAL